MVNQGDVNPFVSLLSAGNAAADQTLVWDAENRLVEVRPTTPVSGDKMVEFKYDYLGRRVQKRVLVWDATLNDGAGGWSDSAGLGAYARRFVWSGWLMLVELEGLGGGGTGVPPVIRKYTWGLDLAGLSGGGGPASSRSLEGAGGIGGLLAMQAPGAGPGAGDLNAVYTYDANGNVGQLVAWATGFGGAQGDEWHADRLVAHYEYDPYGGVTAQAGTYADDNPVRFSTKYWDDETGLGYWGYRYYSPSLGRWISRDPIEEEGGPNLHAYVGNGPVARVDALGEHWLWVAELAAAVLCPFPSAPMPLSAPTGRNTSNPWLLWPAAREGEEIVLDPTQGFGRYVLSLSSAQGLRTRARADLRFRLSDYCTCCKPGPVATELLVTGGPFSTTAQYGMSTGGPSWVYAFASINGLHLQYVAVCNLNNCCTHCKATCAINYMFFDSFHFSINPIQRGPLQGRFFTPFVWYVFEQTTEKLAISCHE